MHFLSNCSIFFIYFFQNWKNKMISYRFLCLNKITLHTSISNVCTIYIFNDAACFIIFKIFTQDQSLYVTRVIYVNWILNIFFTTILCIFFQIEVEKYTLWSRKWTSEKMLAFQGICRNNHYNSDLWTLN